MALVNQKELHFLLLAYLKASPFADVAELLQQRLSDAGALPERFDWQGNSHTLSFEELSDRFAHVSPSHLPELLSRLVSLAQHGSLLPPGVSTLLGQADLSLIPQNTSHIREIKRNDPLFNQDDLMDVDKEDNPAPQGTNHDIPVPKMKSIDLQHEEKRLALIHRVAPEKKAAAPKAAGRSLRHIGLVGMLNARRLGAPLPADCSPPLNVYNRIRHLKVIRGHGSAVYCANWDKTGGKIITGSDDYLVKIWSARSGYLLRTLRGHEKEITDLAVDFTSQFLATSSNDCTVRVWSLVNGAHMAVLRGHEKTVATVSWCPSVKHPCILSASLDGTIRIWTEDPAGSEFPDTLKYNHVRLENTVKVTAFAWSPGGTRFVTGGQDGRVRVFNVRPPALIAEMPTQHNREVMSVSWSHRGPRFATAGSQDGTIRIWDINHRARRYECVKTLQVPAHHIQQEGQSRHHPRLTNIAWSMRDDFIVASCCIVKQPSKLMIWNAKTGELVHAVIGHQADSYVLDAHPTDHRVFLTASYDRTVILWDIYRGVKLRTFMLTNADVDNKIVDAHFSPQGDSIVVSDVQGHFEVFGTCREEFWAKVPSEQYFDTDYHAFSRDENDYLVDNNTRLPPHQMPKPTLCNYMGIPADYQPSETLTLESQPGMDPAVYETNKKIRAEKEEDEEKTFNSIFQAPVAAPPPAPPKQTAASRRREAAVSARLTGEVLAIPDDDDLGLDIAPLPTTNRPRGRLRRGDSVTNASNIRTLGDIAMDVQIADDELPPASGSPSRGGRRLRRQASVGAIASIRDFSSSDSEDEVGSDREDNATGTAEPVPGSAAAFTRERVLARQRRNGRRNGGGQSSRQRQRAQQQRQRRAQEEEYALSDDDEEFEDAVSEESEDFNPAAPAEIPSLSTSDSEEDSEIRAIRLAKKRQIESMRHGTGRRGRPRIKRSSSDEDDDVEELEIIPRSQRSARKRQTRKSATSGDNDSDEGEESDDGDGLWTAKSNIRSERMSARELRERRSQVRSLREMEEEMDQQLVAEEKRLQELQIQRHRKEKIRFYPVWLRNCWPQLAYSPQLEDEVVFFRKGHELYLNEYQEFNEDKLPDQLPELAYCRVVDIEYLRYPFIHCRITLESLHPHPRIPRLISNEPSSIDAEALAEVEQHESFYDINQAAVKFAVRYHAIAAKSPEFLSLRSRFDQAMAVQWFAGKRFAVWMYDERQGDAGKGEWYKGTISAVAIPDSSSSSSSASSARSSFPDAWECLSVVWDGSEETGVVSPWEIEELDNEEMQVPVQIETINPDESTLVALEIESFCEQKDVRTMAVFMEEVAISKYPDYPNLNPKPIDVNTILLRLKQKYYRSIAQLLADIQLLAGNCKRFNGADHDFSVFADELVADLMGLVEQRAANLYRVMVPRELEEGSVNDPVDDQQEQEDNENDDAQVVEGDDDEDEELDIDGDVDSDDRSSTKKRSKKTKKTTTRTTKSRAQSKSKTSAPSKSKSKAKPASKSKKRKRNDAESDLDELEDAQLAAALAASRLEAEQQGILPKRGGRRSTRRSSALDDESRMLLEDLDEDEDEDGEYGRSKKRRTKPAPRSRKLKASESSGEFNSDEDDVDDDADLDLSDGDSYEGSKRRAPKPSRRSEANKRKNSRLWKVSEHDIDAEDDQVDVEDVAPLNVPTTGGRRLASLRVTTSSSNPSPFNFAGDMQPEEPRKSGRIRFRTDPVAGRSEAQPLSSPVAVPPPLQPIHVMTDQPVTGAFAASISNSSPGKLPRVTLRRAPVTDSPNSTHDEPVPPPPRKQRKIAESAELVVDTPAPTPPTSQEPPKRKRGRPRKNPVPEEMNVVFYEDAEPADSNDAKDEHSENDSASKRRRKK